MYVAWCTSFNNVCDETLGYDEYWMFSTDLLCCAVQCKVTPFPRIRELEKQIIKFVDI